MPHDKLKPVITTDQIQKRIKEMARHISNDYEGRTVHALALLDNGFIFFADLVRALEVPVICQFIKPKYKTNQGPSNSTEIFFSHELDIRGHHVLLVEGLLDSGITADFLMGNLLARGAASVKLAALLDRQTARRVSLQPDYFGFLVDEAYLVGYGLGSPAQLDRNLPYLAASQPARAVT